MQVIMLYNRDASQMRIHGHLLRGRSVLHTEVLCCEAES